MKKFKVYTQEGYWSERFYIEDENQEDMVFEARSEGSAIFQAAEYVRKTSMFDKETTEKYISLQNWCAEEV